MIEKLKKLSFHSKMGLSVRLEDVIRLYKEEQEERKSQVKNG